MHNARSTRKLKMYFDRISAGFPSPASDLEEERLDLNELLVDKPEATFFIRVSGDSMKNAYIQTNDILVVDRSKIPNQNDIVVALVDNEFTVKRFQSRNNQIFLIPENNNYRSIKITSDMNFQVWGVVTSVIHQM